MTIFTIILLIVLGLVLLLIEFAVIPGVTIAGIGGFLLLAVSVFIAFSELGTIPGIITLAVVLVASPIMIVYFFKSKPGKKMILGKNIEGKIDSINQDKLSIGDIGKTIGRLAPMGKVRVNSEVIEAQSIGMFIDQNTQIKIVKVESNKIIVEPLKK